MSWNEPGRDRDPWNGGGSGGGGPPDLDQMFRRLRQRLAALLRRRPGPPRTHWPRLWWLAPVVLVALWLLTGFFQVPAGNQGVRVRLGRYAGTSGPGAHWQWPWPIARVHIVDMAQRRSIGQRNTVLTQDGKLADIELTVHYRVSDPYKYVFGSDHPAAVVNALAAAALAAAAGDNTLADLTGKREGAIEQSLQTQLGQAVGAMDLGVDINSVSFSRITLPDAVTAARHSLATAEASAAAAVTAARAAAVTQLAGARRTARGIVAAARADAGRQVARAQAEATQFEALLPAWRTAPAATREMLRRSVLSAILSAAPKVVVVGPIGSVQIPSWPAPAASSRAPAPATAKPPAPTKKGGK